MASCNSRPFWTWARHCCIKGPNPPEHFPHELRPSAWCRSSRLQPSASLIESPDISSFFLDLSFTFNSAPLFILPSSSHLHLHLPTPAPGIDRPGSLVPVLLRLWKPPPPLFVHTTLPRYIHNLVFEVGSFLIGTYLSAPPPAISSLLPRTFTDSRTVTIPASSGGQTFGDRSSSKLNLPCFARRPVPGFNHHIIVTIAAASHCGSTVNDLNLMSL